MIDRDARNKLCEAITAYTGESIAAFEFDERIHEIAGSTEDQTVDHTVHLLWHYYDDCEDHKIVATKEEWDYFQRLRLMLESDVELQLAKNWRWSIRQSVAAFGLIVFIYVVFITGLGVHLYIMAIPFGLVSIAISDRWWVQKPDPEEDSRLAPFSSFSDLIYTRRRVRSFSKKRYLWPIASRSIRSESTAFILDQIGIAIWVLHAPVALFYQMFPRRDVSARLVTPSAAVTS